jgi:hypothetical protein
MMIFAIDPGPKQSAFVKWNSQESGIYLHGILPNEDLMHLVREIKSWEIVVCEMVQSFGMPVGKEIFETVLLVGQIKEAVLKCGHSLNLAYRKDIKNHFCGTSRALDSNIRRALLDRFGEQGTKKNPNRLYGIKKDEWSALACAVWYSDITRNL